MSNNVTTWQIMPEVLQFVRKSYARNASPVSLHAIGAMR